MDFTLTDTQHALLTQTQKTAETWADRALEIRRHTLEHGQHHPGFWKDYCAAGTMGFLVPREHGGTGQGLLAAALSLEAFAARGLMLILPVLTNATARLITVAGTEELRARHLPAIADGSLVIGMGFTEAEAGHNFARMSTHAHRDGDHLLVDGEKAYISGADIADRLLLVARSLSKEQRRERGLPRLAGFTAMLVDPRAEGVTLTEQRLGEREGLRQWKITFNDVRVPAADIIGAEHEAIIHLFDALNIERVLFTAISLGGAAHLLDRAIGYAKSRNIFGDQPIGAYQAIAHPLARTHTELESARLLTYKAAALFDQGSDTVTVGTAANMAKLLAADVAYQAADQTLQTFGAAGWDENQGLVDHYLDTRMFRSTPVSQELALNFIAETALGLPRSR
ncbi:acyl-CoA dehydrogenase family protein [Streptomyces sp. NPDC046915]|uniref:acyl-CoA dehydrogenase family protein n=1 Tax=Streptomyces sp. NPDC046915 TaxID=3155257 RepID=UPI00340C8BC6